MNPSHAENEKGLPRWEGGADFGNEFVASLKVIISRDKMGEAEGHTMRRRFNQSIFISSF